MLKELIIAGAVLISGSLYADGLSIVNETQTFVSTVSVNGICSAPLGASGETQPGATNNVSTGIIGLMCGTDWKSKGCPATLYLTPVGTKPDCDNTLHKSGTILLTASGPTNLTNAPNHTTTIDAKDAWKVLLLS